MRKVLIGCALVSLLALAGCASLDKWFLPSSPGQPSAAQTTAKEIQPMVPTPWGELGLLATNVLTAGYALLRGKKAQATITDHSNELDTQHDTISQQSQTIVDLTKQVTEMMKLLSSSKSQPSPSQSA